jgi:hypothetical protein
MDPLIHLVTTQTCPIPLSLQLILFSTIKNDHEVSQCYTQARLEHDSKLERREEEEIWYSVLCTDQFFSSHIPQHCFPNSILLNSEQQILFLWHNRCLQKTVKLRRHTYNNTKHMESDFIFLLSHIYFKNCNEINSWFTHQIKVFHFFFTHNIFLSLSLCLSFL